MNVVMFPKAKKRGRKRSTGPVAEVHTLISSNPERLAANTDPLMSGICQWMKKERESQALKTIRAKITRNDEENEARFLRWLDGVRVSTEALITTTRYGIATDSFGEGGQTFRWAIESVRSDNLLHPAQRDEALRLCIEQLNALGLLARLGGLRATSADKGEAYEFAEQVFADLGSTLRRLVFFGGVCKPTPSERSLLEKSKSEFDALWNFVETRS